MPEKRDWLVKLRESIGISQKDVAIRSGIPRSTYAQYEVGRRNPTVSNAQQIAIVLGFDWTLFFAQKSRIKRQNKIA